MRTPSDANPEQPLDAILGSVAGVRILRELMDEEAHAPTFLAHRTNVSRPAVREALLRLERQHIIVRVGEGRVVLYRLNGDHPLTRRLVKLFRAESKQGNAS
jgi:DNA-binding transcriptional ArsR family regulator